MYKSFNFEPKLVFIWGLTNGINGRDSYLAFLILPKNTRDYGFASDNSGWNGCGGNNITWGDSYVRWYYLYTDALGSSQQFNYPRVYYYHAIG